jgi:CBS domain-containing protein
MAQKIREMMTRGPVTVPASASVREAAQAMRDHDIGDVLVTDDGKLCGMLTDRDLVVRVLADEAKAQQQTAGEVCSHDVTCVSSDADIDQAVDMMRIRALRRLPVVDDGRLVGIVSLGDLAEERDPASALGRISAASPNR